MATSVVFFLAAVLFVSEAFELSELRIRNENGERVLPDGVDGNNGMSRASCLLSDCKFNTTEIQDTLARHNCYRKNVSADYKKTITPLVWNDTLAQLAQGWTDYLASTQKFLHGNTAL